jgi:hypothetical protein
MSPHRRNPWFHYLKWGDFLLAGLISVLAVILLLAMPRAALPAASAALTMDGKVLQQWTAAELTASGEQDLTANGYHYQIAWQNGQIRFLKADCPDQICVHTGWISHTGEIAACVPGHLILKTSGDAIPQTTGTSGVDVIIK